MSNLVTSWFCDKDSDYDELYDSETTEPCNIIDTNTNKLIKELFEITDILEEKVIFYNEYFYQKHNNLVNSLYWITPKINDKFEDIRSHHFNKNNNYAFFNLQYSIDLVTLKLKDSTREKLADKSHYEYIKTNFIPEMKQLCIQIDNKIFTINKSIKDYRNYIKSSKYLHDNLVWYKFDQIHHDSYYLAFLITINLINFIKNIKVYYTDFK